MQGNASRVLAQWGGRRRSSSVGYEGKVNIYEQTVEHGLCECSTTQNVCCCSFGMGIIMGKKECMKHDGSQRYCGRCKYWTIVKCSHRKTYFVGKDRWLELWVVETVQNKGASGDVIGSMQANVSQVSDKGVDR